MESPELDVVIVGAGFAGLYMLHSARELGLSALVIEAGGNVGGTWYWNRYPGARCDVPSMEYSYGFDHQLEQDWEWTERYATQPEILRYLGHVADRFDLRSSIIFGTRVESAGFDDDRSRWLVRTDRSSSYLARFVVMATGCLSASYQPEWAGQDEFTGRTFHTGHWPQDGVDFTKRRVAVIGTGSSAVQSIPLIAAEADEVIVFQRTPAYAVPAHNHPLDPGETAAIKADYLAWRADARATTTGFGGHLRRGIVGAFDVADDEREAHYQRRWAIGGLTFAGSFNDLLLRAEANETAAEFVRSKIRSIVDDPTTAAQLSPDTIIGCKRMCVDTDYYLTFNRENVSLVDVSERPIEAITATGVRVNGTVVEADDIVFATGFDAMTGALDRIDIRGRGGLRLSVAWAEGPKTYLGLQVAGFPNLFTITGPGSPSVLTNMIVSIEHHVEWISALLASMKAAGNETVEASESAQDGWVRWVNEVAEATLFYGCSSWYLGVNVPGKPRVFMPLPGFLEYQTKCEAVAAAGYDGFVVS